jgi:NADH-quinone oxidoreductase subunit H
MQLATILGVFLAGTAGTMVLGLFSKWVDRKVTARVQFREGPPLLQPVYDVLKLLGKETLVPQNAQRTGFLLAPLVGFAAVSVAASILWFTALVPTGVFVGDLIVVIYFLTIPSLCVIIGGTSSGSPYGAIGGSREMKLLISYELPLIVAVVAVLVRAELWTFRLGDLVAYQEVHGAMALHLSGLLALIVGVFCMQAKLGLVPFDIPEAETELMGGPFTEYSGAPLAVFYLARAMLLAVLPMFVITVFMGGIDLGFPGIIGTVVKYVVLLVLIILIRNTNPRVRIDHAVKFFWYILTPVSLAALLLAFAGY